MRAVLYGVVGIIVVLIVATFAAIFTNKDTLSEATAFAAPAITAISTIAAAYFGIKVGQDVASDATQKTETANKATIEAKGKEGDAKAEAAAYEATAKATADQTNARRCRQPGRKPPNPWVALVEAR